MSSALSPQDSASRDSGPWAVQDSDGPLAGVVVIDLSRAVAGPHAAMMLGDLGARVIKVEAPGSGDDSRGWGPPFVGEAHESTYFLSANRNKQSIALDLKHPADLEVARRLIERADVVVENFRTGVMDRLGLGLETLHARNPRLVVLSITGFGHDGPEGGRAGYDQIAQGEGGFMSVTGSSPADPQKVGVPIADLLAGMNGAYGVAAALLERERTGRGKVVRTSLLSSVVGAHGYQGTRCTVAGVEGHADGNHHPSLSPYGLFPCADGLVQIAVGSDRLWQHFCAGFGLEAETGGLATNADRVAQGGRVRELVRKTFSGSDTEQLLARLHDLGIPAGRLRTLPEVYAWDQARSQHLLVEVEHERLGAIRLPGSPLRLFDVDGAETTRLRHAPPPVLDADADRTRRWLQQRPDGGSPNLDEEGPCPARPHRG